MRTELTASISALLNGVLGIAYYSGAHWATPELISGINGIATPLMMIFLGSRINKVQDTAASAAYDAASARDAAVSVNSKVTGKF